MINSKILKNMNKADKYTSKYAAKNKDAIHIRQDSQDIRPPYFRDTDRIIHSLAFSRYLDKTQVFSNIKNDHITKRMIHVQLVSKIARTIGRALSLNEDLIEAASLGHDLGHAPFGHFGESILNKISLEENEGFFHHNVQSVRLLMEIEKSGRGLNITLQTLDAILCHNGEFVEGIYQPEPKTLAEFLEEYKSAYTNKEALDKICPMTLEGCVVRISDVIAYLGRDIEDAVRIKMFDQKNIPVDITSVLGSTNKKIVNTIIMDLINNSIGKPYVKLSDHIYEAIKKLKKFNFEHIYNVSLSNKEKEILEQQFRVVYNYFKKDLEEENTKSVIYKFFLKYCNHDYRRNNSNSRIVIDYIAGMTDDFFQKSYNLIINN